MIANKLVFRFDGPPSPNGPRLIEVELDGKSINAGEWVQDGETWCLVIDNEVVARLLLGGDDER